MPLPLSHSSRDIGDMETRFFTFGNKDNPVVLGCGDSLSEVTLAYETYGTLNKARDNAILVFHALSGSQHAAGYNASVKGVGDLWTKACKWGWWNEFIGPGKAVNTNRFFVICANYLGGCYGSTGPSSTNPRTGRPFGSTFPRVSVADIVDSQVRLLDDLEIDQLHGSVGGSLGGMMCLSLATRYPDRVRIVAPIASGHYVTSLQRIINFEQIFALEQDPNYRNGDYYDGPRPEAGICMARMISHKTFVSLSTLEHRARDEIVKHGDDLSFYRITHPIESYMLHQGRTFTRRFDANTYIRILDAWQNFDLLDGETSRDVSEVFTPCRNQRYMVVSIDSDVCFYAGQQQELTQLLRKSDIPHRRITIHSDKGHDAFLLEPDLLTPPIADAFEKNWK